MTRSPNGFWAPGILGLSHFDVIIGVSEKLTKSEMAIAIAIVTPKLLRKRPGMPPRNATGKKTAMSESVVARTARPISFVAMMVAFFGGVPFST